MKNLTMIRALLLALVAGFSFVPLAAADTYCDTTVPCSEGCCGTNNVCGLGPDYCSSTTCINSCDAKAECNPGGWPDEYVNATACPLNVCCSQYGFCGTTEDFCGNQTVTRPSCDVSSQSITRVIGYYNSAANLRFCGGMTPLAFPQGVYSHIYFAFGSIDPTTFEVIPASSGDEMLYPELQALQIRDLGQELWLSIGGWDFSDSDAPTATTFSDLAAADTATQNSFFQSLTQFMTTYGFSGVDIDWEYPAASDRNGRAEDYENYPTFLANLRSALNQYKFGLSITLPTSYWYLQHFDIVSIEPSVDWFNYMSYDLHGTWDIGSEWTGAYLDAHTNLTEITTALDLLWRNNITASKVTMGMAFYGRSFTLASESCSTPGCSYLSAGNAGNCSDTAGILFNNEIDQIISENNLSPTLYSDAAVKTINWNNDQWVSFDDEDTWKLKADFAKSQCIGGIMVWSVDEDDTNSTYSNGLAAALGNPINIDSTTGLSTTVSLEVTGSTSSSNPTASQYCHFINCGETCPNGFTTVTRADKTSQLMLDSTKCPPGDTATQTLCCPTSGDVPTCQWRGFHNNGHCTAGCNSNEAEVGTVSSGCSKGYQSACCTITQSTTPWSKCKWTDSCSSDQTCPSGYDNFVVSSRQGWGGQKTCSGSKNYNYCCSGSSVPDAFTNCNWVGHEVAFTNTEYCSDACPSGTMRIAEEDISLMFGENRPGKASDCYFGNEAYCCSGPNTTSSSISPRSTTGVPTYQDLTAEEFDQYLQQFLSNPTCPAGWDNQYSASFSYAKRDLLLKRGSSSSSQYITLVHLMPMLASWITSKFPRTDLSYIWNYRLNEYGYGSTGANSTVLTEALYGTVDSWTGLPIYTSNSLLSEALCNIAESSQGLQNLTSATAALCELQSSSSSSKRSPSDDLSVRALSVIGTNARTDDGTQPTVAGAMRGVLNGDLSLHYLRWLNTQGNNGNEVTLEIAFWIGPQVGVAPTSSLHAQYADTSDTAYTDRWIIFHLHLPLDQNTFYQNVEAYYMGARATTVYHSQTFTRPAAVSVGYTANYRAEYRYSSNYRGSRNTGTMANYNSRTPDIECPTSGADSRWYVGRPRTVGSGLQELMHDFGIWMHDQNIFSDSILRRLWPLLPDAGNGWTMGSFNARSGLNPVAGAFDVNFLPDGSTPVSLDSLGIGRT